MAGGEAESLELRPLYLVDDEPVPGYKHDGLDLRQFADVVAGTALGTTGPFTIGVYADWGQGKSSLLNQARSMLQATNRANVVTVMFNAWRYEREEHPIVPLVATIERALAEHLEKHQSALQKASASAWKFLHAARRKARGLIAGLTLGAKGEATVPMLGKLELEVGWSAKDAKERERELAEAEKSQWESWVQRCLYLSAFDRLDELTAEAFGGNARTEDQPRIVVFIDDLDRCLPDKAFELIENIKLVLGQKGFVFVLALNRAVIDAHLRKLAVDRYGEEKADLLDRYLDKIVQLPLPLPSHRERFKSFVTWVIKERLKESDRDVFNELADLLRMGTLDTPRMLVRRLNTLLVDQRLREGMKKLKGDLGNEKRPYKEFLGLCVVQRTLQDVLEASVLKGLSEDQKLCDLVAKEGVGGRRNWIIEECHWIKLDFT